ncbi:MAG: DMT family transporter [Caldilineae bacterium]|nr:MAG: DMT family transporter [Caldilineae bacterium]
MAIEALPYVTLLGFLFGSTLIASRFSVGQFHPTTYIGLRMVLASLGHIAVYTLGRRPWPRSLHLWRHAVLLGIFGTAIPMTAIVSSLKYQSSGVTAVLLTTGPAITVLMAHFLLHDERLTGRKGMGIALALGGALLLAARGESGLPDVQRASPLGYGLVLGAMVFSSGMTIYARKYMRHLDAFDVASVRMVAAALTVMPLSALVVGVNLSRVTVAGYLALGWASAVGTFAGMMLAFYNIKRFGATAAAMTQYIIPVVAGIGGVVVLGERITAGMGTGMALIGGGIALLKE